MNINKVFKSYNQRIPKKVKEAAEKGDIPEVPEEEFTVVDIKGTKTCHSVNQRFSEIADELMESIDGLVSTVKDQLIEQGADASILSRIPDLNVVREELKKKLTVEDTLKTAFRDANSRLFFEANPELDAIAHPPKEKSESGRGGVKLNLDF